LSSEEISCYWLIFVLIISFRRYSPGDYDSFGQDQCRVLARENELTDILRTIKESAIKNVVSLTSDVHFTAAIRYNPNDAVFKEFDPFYEFVIGPIHAGSFGPGELDGTFGPSYEFLYAPGTQGYRGGNLPPPFLQSFGMASVSANGTLAVRLMSVTGAVLYQRTLQPEVPCNASFSLWNGATDARVATLVNGGTISSPPCSVNIQATVNCTSSLPVGPVTIDLLSGSRVIRTRVEAVAPYFLFGDNVNTGDVFGGSITPGTYSVRITVGAVALPETSFTVGACV
jgi:PhoD-like phosphatase